jgi:hypothetical protein
MLTLGRQETTLRRDIVQLVRFEADGRLVPTMAFSEGVGTGQDRRRHALDEWGAKGGMTRLEARDLEASRSLARRSKI